MVLQVIFGVSVLVIFALTAVAGIVLNRRECRSIAVSQHKQVSDFTKGYICIYSVLIVATGFILAKAGFFGC